MMFVIFALLYCYNVVCYVCIVKVFRLIMLFLIFALLYCYNLVCYICIVYCYI